VTRDLLELAIRTVSAGALLYAAVQAFGLAWVGLVLALGAAGVAAEWRLYL
jgi:hypothetical protein